MKIIFLLYFICILSASVAQNIPDWFEYQNEPYRLGIEDLFLDEEKFKSFQEMDILNMDKKRLKSVSPHQLEKLMLIDLFTGFEVLNAHERNTFNLTSDTTSRAEYLESFPKRINVSILGKEVDRGLTYIYIYCTTKDEFDKIEEVYLFVFDDIGCLSSIARIGYSMYTDEEADFLKTVITRQDKRINFEMYESIHQETSRFSTSNNGKIIICPN